MNVSFPALRMEREAIKEDEKTEREGVVSRVCGKLSLGFVELHGRISTLRKLQEDKDRVC